MAQTTHPQSITAHLDLIINSANLWLVPTVEAECPRVDAAKLRTLMTNLTEIRARIAEAEQGVPADQSLSRFFEEAAERWAACTNGVTLSRAQVIEHVALFNEAAAWAWTHELAARLQGGQTLPADGPVLRLAKVLDKAGVHIVSDLDQAGGGGAA